MKNWLEKHLEYINKRGGTNLTIHQFNTKCGLTKNHLNKNVKKNVPIYNYTLSTLHAIAEGSNMSLSELLKMHDNRYK